MKRFIFSFMILLTSLQLDATKAPNRPILSDMQKAKIKLEKIKQGKTIIDKYFIFTKGEYHNL